MSIYRVSYNHQQTNTRTGGWLTNFWNNAASFDQAKTRSFDLAIAIDNLQGEPTFLRSTRISTIGQFRNARTILSGDQPGSTFGADTDSDYPVVALQVKLYGNDPKSTLIWLRGINDIVVQRGGIYTPSASFTTSFNAFKAVLLNSANGWKIYIQDPAIPRNPVTAITGLTGVVTCPNHGLVTGDYTRISRANGLLNINGVWRVTVTDANTFTLQGWTAQDANMTRSNATSTKQSKVDQAVTGVEVVQVTSHRVGKPSGLLGGRRRRPGKSLVGPLVAK